MDHILARLKGAKIGTVKAVLKADAAEYVKQGLVLRHVWLNSNDPDEVVFIFTATDLNAARKFIEGVHSETRRANPDTNLPQMLYLKGQ